MYLDNMLEQLEFTCLQGDVHILVTELVYDSRKASKGCVFVCIAGAVSDGHGYIDEVVQKGAAAIIVSKDMIYPSGVTVIRVNDTRKALAYMAAAYFGHPAERLKTIGITGTKGKTTTAYMIRSILEDSGIKTGQIGTIETIIGEKTIPAGNTTPESYMIQKYFAEMVDAGCGCVVMEASSQGLMLNRMDGFTFDYGLFTNIEPDHIGGNEHKDFEDYLTCKSKLFRQCKVGLINIDDPHANEILNGHTCQVETYGYSEKAELRAEGARLLKKPGYLGVAFHVSGLYDFDVEVDIPGKFSVYNSLGAIAVCRHFDISSETIRKALDKVRVRGRVELVPVSDKFTVIIDYAHNAMSLKSLLTTICEYHPKRLVCMFGCGGNRSKDRRFEMGEISSNMADLTVVTSDNPRYEEPMDIINDILVGVKKGHGKFVEIPGRKDAVRYCIGNAEEGDVIVIAGKGHEDYQEIKGVKHHMDDRGLIRDVTAGI